MRRQTLLAAALLCLGCDVQEDRQPPVHKASSRFVITNFDPIRTIASVSMVMDKETNHEFACFYSTGSYNAMSCVQVRP